MRLHLAAVLLPMTLMAAPPSAKKPVTDTFHGGAVTEEYRWLENFSDPAVKEWTAAQNRASREFLDHLPNRAALQSQLQTLYGQRSASYGGLHYRGSLLFAIKNQPPKQQALLVTLASPDDLASEHVILDPNLLDAKGGTSIDWYVPSHDGRYVAVSLAKGGSEEGDVHVYEAASGKPQGDVVPRVNGGTAGGSVAWNADGTGFFYTRYPRGNERAPQDRDFYQQVWFHPLGQPTEKDRYEIGKEFPRIAEVQLLASGDHRFTLAAVANGDGGEFTHYLKGPAGPWVPLTTYADQVIEANFGPDDSIYLLSRRGAPKGRLLRLSPGQTQVATAQVMVPESDGVIKEFVATPMRLFVVDLLGGPSRLRVFNKAGQPMGEVPIEPISTVSQVVRTPQEELLFLNSSYVDPPAWFRYSPVTKQVAKTALAQKVSADFSDIEVTRDFAVSQDGTKIPLNIIRKKGIGLTGQNPTILYGYGGYSISLSPSFNIRQRVLLDRGVVYVIANLRGGGEYGEEWHRAGNLTRKQNVFDDFAAAAKYLIDRKYTNPQRLAIEGGSNGGLLMGAALTQHPELYRAVLAYVGIYDMLRVELSPNGAFNVTEFGTVKEADQFKALYAYSPYHHVKNGVQYPAVLLMTGDNDPRVDPMHSRKMTARLQASGTKRPVLLRTTSNAGHGIGTALSERIAQETDALSFVLNQIQ